MCANKLSLNVQKTYFMVFHRAKMKIVNPIDVTMNNCCLKNNDSLKYICVIIDYRLNWSQHIAHVKNKVSKGIGIMYRARIYITKSSVRKLYFSYIYPYLIYYIEIWGISPQSHLRPLFLLQKNIVRIITFSTYYAHTYPLLKDLNILTIDKLVVHRIGNAMYKIYNVFFPSVLNELLVYKKNNVIHDHNSRTKDMFRVSLSLSTVSVRIWNALIVKFNVNVPLTRFKSLLKQYLSSNILTISYPK